MVECFSALSSNTDFNQACSKITEMLDSLLEGIKDQRESRLCSRPIDPNKLKEIEDAVSEKVFDKNSSNFPLFLFDKVSYSNNLFEEFTLHISNYPKGCLVTPPMDFGAANQEDLFNNAIYDCIGRLLINDVLKEENRKKVKISSEENYWTEIKKFISEQNGSYILFVHSRLDPKWLIDWENSNYTRQYKSLPHDLKICKSDNYKNRPGYFFHINDIAVYCSPIVEHHSFLIPETLFEEVRFTIYPNGKKVKVDFESDPDSAKQGTVKITFSMSVKIKGYSILELVITQPTLDKS